MNGDAPLPQTEPTLPAMPAPDRTPRKSDRIDLEAPDIARYAAGHAGLPYVLHFDSVRPGPHVMLVAATHGNELCGVIALDRLLRDAIRPIRGSLTFCFANHAAYRRFDPCNPVLSRFVDEDLNRVWGLDVLDGPGRSLERQRARELRPLVDTADLLLDIHSMQTASEALLLAGPLTKGRALASAVSTPVQVVSDRGHAGGVRLRDYGAFADPDSPRNALLVECGQHWDHASADVALETAAHFLLQAGAVAADAVRAYLRPNPPGQRFIEVTDAVTVRRHFRFVRHFASMEIIPEAGTLLGHDDGEPVLTPYDNCILIMPSPRCYPGQTAVRLGRQTN